MMHRSLTLILAAGLAAASMGAAWAQAAPFGEIEYVEGTATVTRSGQNLGDANIGDLVYPDDMIKTATDGLVVIALDKSTGMRGNLTIKAKTAAYLRVTRDQAGVKSGIDLLAGQIASKLGKLAGSPSFQVSTESAVAGVRGTEFGVATSVNGSILIYCSEGEVSASDGKETVAVPAGNAVEKRPAERLRRLAAAISSPEQFEQRWLADEIEAFRVNAPKALADFERRYAELFQSFARAFEPLQKSDVLSRWIREDAAGLVPSSTDAATLRDKKDVGPLILEIRKVLFVFERIYYRIDQLEGVILGTKLEQVEIRKGLKAVDFLRKVKAEADALERRVALFRYAERLYQLRNEGGAGLPGSGAGDDFFDSQGDWDF
ncbi:MAG: FecR domain-containing protein [Spirochaetales bacterium]|nr:FecR domain-containing protein [Spirochaetales bacterium]MBP7264006.1 FecR domain-containing protein [Spirochaetia bacterium]